MSDGLEGARFALARVSWSSSEVVHIEGPRGGLRGGVSWRRLGGRLDGRLDGSDDGSDDVGSGGRMEVGRSDVPTRPGSGAFGYGC